MLQEVDFKFETTLLDVPAGNENAEDFLVPEPSTIASLQEADGAMGHYLD